MKRQDMKPDRRLATVLFTDIVGSTERAGELGDRAWCEADPKVQPMVEEARSAIARLSGAIRE